MSPSPAPSRVSWRGRPCQCHLSPYRPSRGVCQAGLKHRVLHRYGTSKASPMRQGGLWAQWSPQDPQLPQAGGCCSPPSPPPGSVLAQHRGVPQPQGSGMPPAMDADICPCPKVQLSGGGRLNRNVPNGPTALSSPAAVGWSPPHLLPQGHSLAAAPGERCPLPVAALRCPAAPAEP